MAKKTNDEAVEPVDPNARLIVTPEDKAKAAKWFSRARELGDKRQFDYALEYYVNGMEFWPDAVEEACKPLHGCAVGRRQAGGKKPGLKDTMKRSLTDKNPKQAFLNALWLFGHDPDSLAYMEALARNASRLRAEDAAKWAGSVFHRALDSAPKSSAKQFQMLTHLFEELGDRAAARGESEFGVGCYQTGVEVLNLWRRRFPKDQAAENTVKDLSTKLTILKGKYSDGGSYRDSIDGLEEQADLHDQQRSVQSDDRLDDLIAKADAEHQKNPGNPIPIKQLVDLLCRRERKDEESRAIGLLVAEYKRGGEYRWKHLADEVRMKQLGREVREADKAGDAAGLKEKQIAQLRFELTVFKERVDKYPTDTRSRFEYAVRKFRAGHFDEAIPLFQSARNDPKNRAACGMYLGRCFFRKGYYSEAIAAFEEAIKDYEITDDALAKTMLYWLGRSQEAAGEQDGAKKTYGNILQLDYNYKDVRARLDDLAPPGQASRAG